MQIIKRNVLKTGYTSEEYINMFEKNAKFVERKKEFKKFAKTMEAELNENDIPDVIEPAPVFKVFQRTYEAKGKDFKLQFDAPTRFVKTSTDKMMVDTEGFKRIQLNLL